MGKARTISLHSEQSDIATRNPTLILWGREQSERMATPVTNNSVATTIQGDAAFLRWKIDDSELWFGATSDMVDILTADEASTTDFTNYADHTPNDGSTRGEIYFKLQAGVWRFEGELSANNRRAYDTFRLFKVRFSGADEENDEMLANSMTEPSGTAQAPGNPPVQFETLMPPTLPFIVGGDDVFYISAFGSRTPINTAQWLLCEYLGEAPA